MAFSKSGGRESSADTGGVGALTAFIDQGSEFSGKLSFKDTVRIDGRFEGEIASENTLIVGETGLVKASIDSETVILSGEVHGDILARKMVHLHKSARVFGNLQTRSLIVEDGAQLNGQVEMLVEGKSNSQTHDGKANAKNQGDKKPKDGIRALAI